MTTLAHRPALGGSANGGVAARRAVIRWAGRMFRREWRQQVLVVLLLAIAVTAAIGSITIVRNSGAQADNAAEFGTADQVTTLGGSDRRKLREALDFVKKSWGTVDLIGHRSVSVPGGVEKLDYRAQDPNGAYGGGLLALRQGRYPTGSREVAVTERGGGVTPARARVDPGARRRTTEGRRHRREPAQAERRVRSPLSRVRLHVGVRQRSRRFDQRLCRHESRASLLTGTRPSRTP